MRNKGDRQAEAPELVFQDLTERIDGRVAGSSVLLPAPRCEDNPTLPIHTL